MPEKRGSNRIVWIAIFTVAVTALAVFLDQWSKAWAVANLVEKETKPVLGDILSLNLVFNSGAAFSIGNSATWIFTIISAAVVVSIIWLLCTGRVRSYTIGVILGLIAGGAIGNLLDRLEIIDHGLPKQGVGSGHVIDFLDYNGWFVGNVADIWIVFGFIFLAGYMLAVGDAPGVAKTKDAEAKTAAVGTTDDSEASPNEAAAAQNPQDSASEQE